MKTPPWIVGVLSVALGVSLSLHFSRARAGDDPASTTATTGSGPRAEVEAACPATCDAGDCVHGRCLPSGRCSRDSDCDDGNQCTAEWCQAGRCAGQDIDATCAAIGRDAGVCEFGFCEPMMGSACLVDSDCGAPANGCIERACLDGRCARGRRDDGLACVTPAGARGQCAVGACVAGGDDSKRSCTTRYSELFGWFPDCRRGLKFTLTDSEITDLERALEVRLAENLRYDMKAVLVGTHVGGYNIVLHNRRSRDEVRGLCDPSFVAFDLASYTASTNWKSVNLHVWLEAHRGGWAVPTRGSRVAVDQGRANSVLGAYGVVDVKTFRTWLERAFSPIREGVSTDGGSGSARVAQRLVVAPLPRPPDAGIDAGAVAVEQRAVDAGAKPALTGRQSLERAWHAFGDGRLDEARRLVREARARGSRDPDLEELLASPP